MSILLIYKGLTLKALSTASWLMDLGWPNSTGGG